MERVQIVILLGLVLFRCHILAQEQLIWSWIYGSNTDNHPGIYGEKGTDKNNYVPGARSGAVGWFDSVNRELWLFGGYGYAANSLIRGTGARSF